MLLESVEFGEGEKEQERHLRKRVWVDGMSVDHCAEVVE